MDRLTEWILRAPPMNGGEYFSIERMLALWEALNTWVASACREHGGIHPFLAEEAPKWQQVGRVCFIKLSVNSIRQRGRVSFSQIL